VACASHESSSAEVSDQPAFMVEDNGSAFELGPVGSDNVILASVSCSHDSAFKILTKQMASRSELEFGSSPGG
jgi:hypothetical protein